MPLWIANFAISKLAQKENVSFEDFISKVFEREKSSPQAPKSSPEEIEVQFMEIANRERKKLKKED